MSKSTQSQNILILGSTGPLGLHVVGEAIAVNWNITLFVRSPEKLTQAIKDSPNVKVSFFWHSWPRNWLLAGHRGSVGWGHWDIQAATVVWHHNIYSWSNKHEIQIRPPYSVLHLSLASNLCPSKDSTTLRPYSFYSIPGRATRHLAVVDVAHDIPVQPYGPRGIQWNSGHQYRFSDIWKGGHLDTISGWKLNWWKGKGNCYRRLGWG